MDMKIIDAMASMQADLYGIVIASVQQAINAKIEADTFEFEHRLRMKDARRQFDHHRRIYESRLQK